MINKEIFYLVLFFSLVILYLLNEFDFISKSKPNTFYLHFGESKPKKHANPNNIKFVLNPEFLICGDGTNKQLTLVSFVVIGPDFIDKRTKIRSTWGSNNLNISFRTIFVTGLSKNQTVNSIIKNEFNQFKDIVQGDFIDTYYMLTPKVIMAFKWISKYCSNSYFTLRQNDDVVLNPFKLVKYLETLLNNTNKTVKNKVMGVCHENPPVSRNPQDKFYVSYEQYNRSTYDSYCEGSAVILTTELTGIYYELSLDVNMPPFSVWLEDVYLGILGKKVNTSLANIHNHFTPWSQYLGYTKEKKLELLRANKETFFLFEKDDVLLFWNEILNITKHS